MDLHMRGLSARDLKGAKATRLVPAFLRSSQASSAPQRLTVLQTKQNKSLFVAHTGANKHARGHTHTLQ